MRQLNGGAASAKREAQAQLLNMLNLEKLYHELLTIDREQACYYGNENNKKADSTASFSSVYATSEMLGFNNNGFKMT